jgi:hypothetical protein
LDVPVEANRDKHINFVAEERSELDPSENDSTGRRDQDLNKKTERNKNKVGPKRH